MRNCVGLEECQCVEPLVEAELDDHADVGILRAFAILKPDELEVPADADIVVDPGLDVAELLLSRDAAGDDAVSQVAFLAQGLPSQNGRVVSQNSSLNDLPAALTRHSRSARN